MSTDPLDQPEPEPSYELAVPFIVCASHGGPHDDLAFVSGFECGTTDARLTAIAAAGGHGLFTTVHTANVRQLELLAIDRGFPRMTCTDHGDGWTSVLFEANTGSPA